MSLPDYIYIGIFAAVGIGLVLVAFIASWVIRPQKPNENKLLTYECGELTIGPAWVQYNVAYYIFALIFVIFDVEVIFMVPWAVVYKSMGLAAFIDMFIFVVILLFGLGYAWKKGFLKWF